MMNYIINPWTGDCKCNALFEFEIADDLENQFTRKPFYRSGGLKA